MENDPNFVSFEKRKDKNALVIFKNYHLRAKNVGVRSKRKNRQKNQSHAYLNACQSKEN